MSPKALIAALALAAFLGACSGNKRHGNPNTVANLPQKEIRDLSYAIKGAPSYRQDFRRAVAAIHDSVADATSAPERCRLYLSLARKFRQTNTDSSLFYAHRARTIAETLDSSFVRRVDIAIINALSTAGLFTRAVELFSAIPASTLSPDVRLAYWFAGRRLYGYMKGYAQGNVVCYEEYSRLCEVFDDSIIAVLPKGNAWRTFLECERLVSQKRFHDAEEGLEGLLSTLPQESNLYGMAAFQMAEVWRSMGNEQRYAALLAISALSDVKGCISEGLALPTLANWLYEQGELGDAFAFINFALEEAFAGNARMRAVTIARFVPLIDDAYRGSINSSRDELMVYFILVTVLLIATAVLIFILVKQVRRAKENERQLTYTARRQESYIGNFIGLYSTYADRLHSLTRLVSTKLAAGQVSELRKLVESGRYSDQDNDDIYKIFDSAFLDIYPDFVARVNTLLRPEEQVAVKTPGTLTPELRIYAFVKLGIDESTRIARILHYSINTVYAYRNKMRNKAISRDTFDSDIQTL